MGVSLKIRRQLFEAVCAGDADGIRIIAANDPEALREGWGGWGGASYLHLAAAEGHTNVCTALIELGIDINTPVPETGVVPLDKAASAGHLNTVQWLLKRGAAVDGLPTSISTPLMGAAIEGRLEITTLLLDGGAEINREHLRLPQTALDFAVFYQVKKTGQEAVATLLRERGGIRPYTEKHDWN